MALKFRFGSNMPETAIYPQVVFMFPFTNILLDALDPPLFIALSHHQMICLAKGHEGFADGKGLTKNPVALLSWQLPFL